MTTGRTALVTGASAGLGSCFAGQLAQQGYDLVLVARRGDRLAERAAALRAEHAVDALPLVADLAEPGAPRQIFDELASRQIHVDYLVNNAGKAGPHLLENRDWIPHAEHLQLMMISVAHMCHLFIPPMREAGFGRVINISSVAGRIPRSGGCNYGPTKAYLVNLSEELALTLAGTGVHVCALCPGFTHTDFHETAGMMEMKRRSPSFLWYDAETVVRDGLRAVERGRSVYVTGRLYRLLDPFFQSVWTRRFFRFKAAQ